MFVFGTSWPVGKAEMREFLLPTLKPGDKICDMGPGGGSWFNLLGPEYHWTGVEIWHETAEYLKDIYNVVYELDLRKFDYPEDYDLVIFGDVLEHLAVPDAQAALNKARQHSNAIVVAVPYKLKQGPAYGNMAEMHLQDDLTPEIFNQRYPGFTLIRNEANRYGYYYWRKDGVQM